jgi:ATP-binding cassette, subfamily B, bacterial PglK
MLLSTTKKIWYLLTSKERIQAIIILIFMCIGAALELLGIGIIPVFTSFIVQPQNPDRNPVIKYLYQIFHLQSHQELITVIGIFLIAVFIFKSIFLVFLSYVQHEFIFNKMRSFAVSLYKTYLRSPYPFHLARNSSELVNLVNNETYHLFVSVILPYMVLLTELVLMTLIAIALIAIEPVGTLAAVLLMAFVSITYYQLIKRKIGVIGKLRQFHAGKMVQWIDQGLSGIKEIKVAGKEEFFIHNFDRHVKGFTAGNKVALTLENVPRLALETVAVIAIVSLVIIGLSQGRSSGSLLSGITLFAVAAFRLLPAVNRILTALTSMRYNVSALDAIYYDIQNLKEQPQLTGHNELELNLEPSKIRLDQSLEFKHVGYHYPQSEQSAIPNLSLTMPKGQVVGIVGHSGAGKTTFVDLLLGLLVPTSGQILADGIDITTNISSWRRNVGYIPQNIYLFDDTVRANIAFGYFPEQIDDNRIWKVLQAVQLEEFIAELPEQLDTSIGESGVRLSGGQRQRIGIARALYHNPRLLIMDEATSALDNQTEQAVTQAIEKLSKDRTVVIIAHRLSTVQKCDVIYMMGKGKILCSGTYNELLANNLDFQKLALTASHSA